ncbi:MAG TPA: hypothetical protein VN238_08165 [Solirubrobacteraceae bacterium]|nr:hypothetical protein [Solirubrobacteraceae bacterium]
MITEGEFQTAVAETVGSFLEARGFRSAGGEGYGARFAADEVVFSVDLDAGRSWQLEVSARMSRDSEPSLALSDLLRAAGAKEEQILPLRLVQVTERETLVRELLSATAALDGHLRPALAGDAAFFENARRIRSDHAAAYTARVVDRSRIAEADEAWTAKDYDRVNDILDPVRERLDETHARRLAYAKRKL